MTRHVLVFAAGLIASGWLVAGDWPGWRGPNGDGVVTDPAVPTTWTATENVRWKVPVPGVGHSSPVVSAGRVFLTTYLPDTAERAVLCFDRAGGKRLWQTPVLAAPAEKMHRNNTPASSTPVADGTHVWTTFVDGGRIAVACHDFAGRPVWVERFAGFESPHGFCGTPVLCENLVIVNGDSDGDAFLAGLDKATGKTVWRTARPNKVRSFSTPLRIEVGGKPQLVLAGSKSVAGFDPRTGDRLWAADSDTLKFVATVAYADGVVCATGTSPAATLVGIRPDGAGDVTKTHVAWSAAKGAAYVPSPVAVGDKFFVVTDGGVGSLLEARTGKVLWSERLGRQHDASPLVINGLIYATSTDGRTFVLKPGDECEVVAKNDLGEECRATPAVSDGQLFVRSAKHLWCIGK